MRDGDFGTLAALELQAPDGQRIGERRQDEVDVDRGVQPLDAVVLVIGPFAAAVRGDVNLLAVIARILGLDFRLAEHPVVAQREPVLQGEVRVFAADHCLCADAIALELNEAILRRLVEPILPFCFEGHGLL